MINFVVGSLVAMTLGAPVGFRGLGDLGFRFNGESGRCERDGVVGQNPGFVGECGDLTRVYLFGRDLRGANLRGAILFRANLAHADLSGADLRGANLTGAYLYRARFAGADLRDVIFGTRFRGADLYRVELEGARFDECSVLPFSTSTAEARRMVPLSHRFRSRN
jgi:uncharacterized protein YjbI with pentapeptide repeats